MSPRRFDARLARPAWSAVPDPGTRGRVRVLGVVGLAFAVWYFAWLLQPERIGHPVLFGILLAAEAFNLTQAVGFWWTCASERVRRPRALGTLPDVDVFIPVYNEPVEIVAPTIAAAVRLRGARVRVAVLDDGGNPELEAVARRHGAAYIRRQVRRGAKAGNINHALRLTDAPYVAVFDCDHVPSPEFLRATLGHMADPRIAFVQTPQYYANARWSLVSRAAAAQQALFFGAIARGKDGLGAIFCCGTNVVFRRTALEQVGGFPERSLTEDFELSVRLHQRGWKSAYLPRVLASGLGPEDMSSYVSQQQRWARGCLSAIGAVVRARLPWRIRVQYLLSSMYFFSGWTMLVYMSLPVIRILTGAQPLAGTSADDFVIHFAPYFTVALVTVAVASGGSYTFAAFALASASFWIHIHATVAALLRRPARFVVTPKQGAEVRQPRAVAPALVAVAVLVGVAAYGLAKDQGPATLNNVAFAALHTCVLLAGAWGAFQRVRSVGTVAGSGQAAHAARAA